MLLAGHGWTSVPAAGTLVPEGAVSGLTCDSGAGYSSGTPAASATCTGNTLTLVPCQRVCTPPGSTRPIRIVAGTPDTMHPQGTAASYPAYGATPVAATTVRALLAQQLTYIPGSSPPAFLLFNAYQGFSLLKMHATDPSLNTIQLAVPSTWKSYTLYGWSKFSSWGILIDPATLDVYVGTWGLLHRLTYPGGPDSGNLPTKVAVAGCYAGDQDPDARPCSGAGSAPMIPSTTPIQANDPLAINAQMIFRDMALRTVSGTKELWALVWQNNGNGCHLVKIVGPDTSTPMMSAIITGMQITCVKIMFDLKGDILILDSSHYTSGPANIIRVTGIDSGNPTWSVWWTTSGIYEPLTMQMASNGAIFVGSITSVYQISTSATCQAGTTQVLVGQSVDSNSAGTFSQCRVNYAWPALAGSTLYYTDYMNGYIGAFEPDLTGTGACTVDRELSTYGAAACPDCHACMCMSALLFCMSALTCMLPR